MKGMRKSALAGKVIVITGAARGLGFSYANHALAAGACVIMNDVAGDTLREAVTRLDDGSGRVAWQAGSVADPSTADALVSVGMQAFGRVDGLVNNAGIRPEGFSWDEDPTVTRRAVETNLLGPLYCGAAALRQFRRQGSGSLVNVSSRAQSGVPESATYSATKGAVASLTYSWAIDAPPGVRVNAIAPQARATGTRRLGAVARPEEPLPDAIAPLVSYLLSDAARAVNGQVVRIVGTPAGIALGYMDHPRDVHLRASADGWSVERIEEAFASELEGLQVPVGAAASEASSKDATDD